MNEDLSEIRSLLKEIANVLYPIAMSLKRLADIATRCEYDYSDLNVDADE